ncbi:hypothetical protein SS50377_27200 [Spironucleus salmonicida]|uniref:Uncharacterized protein n=1 Tax=Spironucleus salmonicida TaxID=348837 RepID=V6LWF4_9EUKA|nr:hypothetical protein SS50377_27200 [Spironucleus salmonicida]|eukprot:EST48962.1 Hypothetical protein SS50377_10810 [Spironucleus salmonicida]
MENQIFASWTKSLTKDMPASQYNAKNVQNRLYSNKYVLFEDLYATNPQAVQLPSIQQKFQRKATNSKPQNAKALTRRLDASPPLARALSEVQSLQDRFQQLRKAARSGPLDRSNLRFSTLLLSSQTFQNIK